MRGKLFLNWYLEDHIVCVCFSFGDIIYVNACVCVFQFRTLRILTDCEKQPLAGFNDSSVSARLLMCVFG